MYVILHRHTKKAKYDMVLDVYPSATAVETEIDQLEWLSTRFKQGNAKVMKLVPVKIEEADVTVKRFVVKETSE